MGEERWRVVKSCENSSPRQTPCLSGFAGERWRVKSIWQNSLPLHIVARFCRYILLLHPITALYQPCFWMRLQKYSICKTNPTFPHNPATPFRKMGKKEKRTGKGMGKKKNSREKKKNIKENFEKSGKITSFILPKHQISKNIRTFAEYKREYQT